MTIGEKISARRKELGLTLEEIGKAVGVGKSTVKKWESGYIANMKRDKISALAKILQISPAEFIGSDYSEFDDKFDTEKLSNESQTYDIIGKVFGSQTAELVQLFTNFNEEGKEKLLDTAQDMSQLDRYKKGTRSELVEEEA